MDESLKSKLNVSVGEFISTLLFSRNQSHVFHWQTSSYAKHKALNEYYDGIVDLVDSIVETYQGTNPIIGVYSNNFKYKYSDTTDIYIAPYFHELLLFVTKNRTIFENQTDLQNIVDEIISLIKSTIYKLEKLK